MRFITCFNGLDAELLRPVSRPERVPKWLPKGRTTIVPRASHALYLSWRVMRLRKGDHFLCPAFTCNTVSRPLQKAGGRPLFFNVNRDMSVDWDHLESLLAGRRRPRALVWYHYLGLPVELDRVTRFCRERGLLFIEDCAHALLSQHAGKPVGSFGDVAVFSVRKMLPVLQAGALVVNNKRFGSRVKVPWRKPGPEQQAYLREKETYLHRLGLQAADRTREVQRPYYREALNAQERFYGDPSQFWEIDPLSWLVMHNADPERVRRARRRNYRAYAREVGEIALLPRLPAGASPMGFPVVLRRRDRVRERLHAVGAESVTHWWAPLMPRGVEKRFGDAMYLANHELTLPCHQGITVEDVRYVCRCLRKLV
ncbi:MAG: DegT/DnrJ/EryC1/StrS family aminotransferase [Planctomycetota bacterium]|jgi:dTDP-4-amino-4,6-dideoxygalactose transaminase